MEKMKVKDVKDLLSRLPDEEDFEFRLYLGKDYRERDIEVPLEIISHHGIQYTKPITNYITLKKEKKKIMTKEVIPLLFIFGSALRRLTRIVYEDGSVEYEEEGMTQRFENPWPANCRLQN